MGKGPSEGASDFDGLSGPLPAPYLLAYDAESPGCRKLVDWIARHDRAGLVVAFPFQNPDLVRVAPELAGHLRDREVFGFDLRTRRLRRGPFLLPALFRRLRGWRWVAPLLVVPGVSNLAYALLRRAR